ncbi:MAG: flagellar hook-length control protein FliK [Sphingomonadales bacterium]|nr:MAG: flagellar hook-length control protein FliK [Sphingomonadales bacterium]
MAPAPAQVQASVAAAVSAAPAAQQPAPVAVEPSGQAAIVQPVSGQAAAVVSQPQAPAVDSASFEAAVETARATIAAVASLPVATVPSTPSSRGEAPAAPAQAAPQCVAQSGTPPTAPITIAALIAQSQGIAAQPLASPLSRALGDTDQPLLAGVAAPGAATLQQVAATPDAQQGTLDMRRQEWTGKMVEMIEAMREVAPAKETRISLMPDALGKVDISVRQEGDRVHVHFAAETQAARQILTDAQPRLAELAEQRGIRLGQTSVDSQAGANAQSGQRQNDAQRPQNPSAPASAGAAKDQITQSDDRVA